MCMVLHGMEVVVVEEEDVVTHESVTKEDLPNVEEEGGGAMGRGWRGRRGAAQWGAGETEEECEVDWGGGGVRGYGILW